MYLNTYYNHLPIQNIAHILRYVKEKFGKPTTVEDVCRDPEDNQVLTDALANDIKIIITGDKDLLDLKTYKGVKIISPKEYWKL